MTVEPRLYHNESCGYVHLLYPSIQFLPLIFRLLNPSRERHCLYRKICIRKIFDHQDPVLGPARPGIADGYFFAGIPLTCPWPLAESIL